MRCEYCGEFDCVHCSQSAAGLPKQLPLEAKRWLVLSRLTNRYQDVLLTPKWTDAELGSLDPALRQVVLNGIETQRVISEKLKHIRKLANDAYDAFEAPTRGKRGPSKRKLAPPTAK